MLIATSGQAVCIVLIGIYDYFLHFSLDVPLPVPPKGRVTQERYSSEPSLRKLIKDLHRCDIALNRYQQNLEDVSNINVRILYLFIIYCYYYVSNVN